MMDKSSKIFMTGATGFIGTTLVRQLLQDGYSIRCISRSEPKYPPGLGCTPENLWQHPNFERFPGDINDIDSIRHVMKGCRYVFHLAGYAKNYAKDPNTFTRVNIEGMKNVCTVAKELGIERIVWTSSIVTFGPTRPGEIGDENMPRITDLYYTEYEKTKSMAEQEAFKMVAEGLPLVIVNPTRVFGPGQLSEGNTVGILINDYTRGRMPVLPNRGINIGNYVLVDDVARGHYLAMEHGRVGERYILGSENVSLKDFFQMVGRISGKKHWQLPMLKPGPMVFSYILLYWAKLTGTYPVITPGWMRTFMVDWTYSCDKARKELGYQPVSLEESLKKTWDWLLKIKK